MKKTTFTHDTSPDRFNARLDNFRDQGFRIQRLSLETKPDGTVFYKAKLVRPFWTSFLRQVERAC